MTERQTPHIAAHTVSISQGYFRHYAVGVYTKWFETEDNQNRKCQENRKTEHSSSKCTALLTLSKSSKPAKQTSESKDWLKHGKKRSDNVLEDSKLPMDGRVMLKKEIGICTLHTTSGIKESIVKHSLLP